MNIPDIKTLDLLYAIAYSETNRVNKRLIEEWKELATEIVAEMEHDMDVMAEYYSNCG